MFLCALACQSKTSQQRLHNSIPIMDVGHCRLSLETEALKDFELLKLKH